MLGVLCIIGYPVQLIREVFFRDCICVDTHLPCYETIAYVLPHFDALTHMVIHVSSTLFVLLKRTYWSVFVRCLLNLIRRLTPWVKFYFGLSLHIFSMVRHCLWKTCATPGACINETWLFSSAAVVPPSKSTELPSSSAAVVPQSKSTEWCSSSAAVVPHKVNLTELCSGSAAVVPHKVTLTELWSSAAPFHLDLWYFRHRTNKHVI